MKAPAVTVWLDSGAMASRLILGGVLISTLQSFVLSADCAMPTLEGLPVSIQQLQSTGQADECMLYNRQPVAIVDLGEKQRNCASRESEAGREPRRAKEVSRYGTGPRSFNS